MKTNEARIGGKVMIRTARAAVRAKRFQLHRITLTVDEMDHVRES